MYVSYQLRNRTCTHWTTTTAVRLTLTLGRCWVHFPSTTSHCRIAYRWNGGKLRNAAHAVRKCSQTPSPSRCRDRTLYASVRPANSTYSTKLPSRRLELQVIPLSPQNGITMTRSERLLAYWSVHRSLHVDNMICTRLHSLLILSCHGNSQIWEQLVF